MHTQKYAAVFIVWLLLTTIPAGCAPRSGAGEIESASVNDAMLLDLPALVVDYNFEGNPEIGGIALTELDSLLPAHVSQLLALSPTQVTLLMEGNIQHIGINLRKHGLVVTVNGREVPSIAWDEESLANSGTLSAMFGTSAPVLESLLPALSSLGVAVIATFPVAEGRETIPAPLGYPTNEMPAAVARQESFLAAVHVPPLINIPVFYDRGGGWHVAGMSPEEWSILTKMPWDSLRLTPEQIEAVVAAGIHSIAITADSDGLHVEVNGLDLPYLSWRGGKLNHLLTVAAQAGLNDILAANGLDADALLAVVDRLLPIVTATEFSLHVFFPQPDAR